MDDFKFGPGVNVRTGHRGRYVAVTNDGRRGLACS